MVRVVGYATGIVTVAGVTVMAAIIPGFTGYGRVLLVLVSVLGLGICHLEARVRLEAGPERLRVVNHLGARELEWAEIIAVSFPMGDPWAHLDLADGTTHPLMALQRADGRRAVRDAHRLAALVRERGEAPGPEEQGPGEQDPDGREISPPG